MNHFYSPSTKGFYREDIHGPRQISVMRPLPEAPEGQEVAQGEDAPDPVYDLVDNPDCNIPADAVEISNDEHIALMNGQATGNHMIVVGTDGKPSLQEKPTAFFFERLRAQRNQMLTATDWTQAGDVPEALKQKFLAYRQALRDLPAKTKDPRKAVFPDAPA